MTTAPGGDDGLAAAAAVSVRGLRKRYGYREVLLGIDLEVRSGTCVAIQGPNGAGKSTLLRILATLSGFEVGEVSILGVDLRRGSVDVRGRVGTLLHESFLRRELTLDENLRFACDLQGLTFRDVAPRVAGLLDRVRLAHRKRDRVGTFSQGMTRRAGIVRSLLHDPELWLLDEPTSSLDAEGTELLATLVREHVARGRSAVVVTHDPDLAAGVADRTLWLADGALAPEGNGTHRTRRGPAEREGA